MPIELEALTAEDYAGMSPEQALATENTFQAKQNSTVQIAKMLSDRQIQDKQIEQERTKLAATQALERQKLGLTAFDEFMKNKLKDREIKLREDSQKYKDDYNVALTEQSEATTKKMKLEAERIEEQMRFTKDFLGQTFKVNFGGQETELTGAAILATGDKLSDLQLKDKQKVVGTFNDPTTQKVKVLFTDEAGKLNVKEVEDLQGFVRTSGLTFDPMQREMMKNEGEARSKVELGTIAQDVLSKKMENGLFSIKFNNPKMRQDVLPDVHKEVVGELLRNPATKKKYKSFKYFGSDWADQEGFVRPGYYGLTTDGKIELVVPQDY